MTDLIYLISFLILIVVAICLYIRDLYIKRQYNDRAQQLIKRANVVTKYKLYTDDHQASRMKEIEDAVNVVKRDYLSRVDLTKPIRTSNLQVNNIKTDYTLVNNIIINSNLRSPVLNSLPMNCITERFSQKEEVPQGFVMTPEKTTFDKLAANAFYAKNINLELAKMETANIGEMTARKATIAQLNTSNANLSDAVFTNTQVSDGVFNGTVVDGGTIQKMEADKIGFDVFDTKKADITRGTVSTSFEMNRLYSPQGELVTTSFEGSNLRGIDTMSGKRADFSNFYADQFKPTTLKVNMLKTPLVDANLVTISNVTVGNASMSALSTKDGAFNELQGNLMTTGLIKTSNLCINEACLTEDMIANAFNSPVNYFSAGLSEYNDGTQTKFADIDGVNRIRGDTYLYGTLDAPITSVKHLQMQKPGEIIKNLWVNANGEMVIKGDKVSLNDAIHATSKQVDINVPVYAKSNIEFPGFELGAHTPQQSGFGIKTQPFTIKSGNVNTLKVAPDGKVDVGGSMGIGKWAVKGDGNNVNFIGPSGTVSVGKDTLKAPNYVTDKAVLDRINAGKITFGDYTSGMYGKDGVLTVKAPSINMQGTSFDFKTPFGDDFVNKTTIAKNTLTTTGKICFPNNTCFGAAELAKFYDVGPQGFQGPQGPQGDQGDKGIVGPEGAEGPVGERGPQGLPAPPFNDVNFTLFASQGLVTDSGISYTKDMVGNFIEKSGYGFGQKNSSTQIFSPNKTSINFASDKKNFLEVNGVDRTVRMNAPVYINQGIKTADPAMYDYNKQFGLSGGQQGMRVYTEGGAMFGNTLKVTPAATTASNFCIRDMCLSEAEMKDMMRGIPSDPIFNKSTSQKFCMNGICADQIDIQRMKDTLPAYIAAVNRGSKDCVYGPWSTWSTCTRDCGGGVTTRTRSATHAINAGAKCEGSTLVETVPCNATQCVFDPNGTWNYVINNRNWTNTGSYTVQYSIDTFRGVIRDVSGNVYGEIRAFKPRSRFFMITGNFKPHAYIAYISGNALSVAGSYTWFRGSINSQELDPSGQWNYIISTKENNIYITPDDIMANANINVVRRSSNLWVGIQNGSEIYRFILIDQQKRLLKIEGNGTTLVVSPNNDVMQFFDSNESMWVRL